MDVSRITLSAPETMSEALVDQATRNPDKIAFTLVEDGLGAAKGAGRDLTYGELACRALQAGARLKERGLRRGERVIVCLPTGAELLTAIYGVMLAGGVCVPVYPPPAGYGLGRWRRRLSAVVGLVQPSGAVVAPKLRLPTASVLEQLGEERFALVPRDLEGAGTERPAVAEPGDLAFIQLTSGTTRQPRGVSVSHGSLIANIEALAQVMPLAPSDRLVSWLPPYHDMGLVGHIFKPVHGGVRQYLMPTSHFWRRPESWLRLLSETRAAETTAPNSAYSMCVRKVAPAARRGLDLSALRWALNGAEMVQHKTLERFVEAFGPCGFRASAFRPVYGLAEATLAVTFGGEGVEGDHVEEDHVAGPRVDWVRRAELAERGRACRAPASSSEAQAFVGLGRPLPGYRLQVACPDRGTPCAEREVGEVWLQGPSVTSGYFNDPQATIKLFAEGGWLRTGDLGYVADGELFITGRRKDVIIRRGCNHHPDEIEQACVEVPGLRAGRAVAFGTVDRRDAGERLVLVVEVQRGVARDGALAEQVAAAVARASGLRPDRVELVPPGALPKTTSGKLRRAEVRQAFESGRRLRQDRRALLGGAIEARARSVAQLAATRARRLLGWP